jgi:hypothetical protein
LSPSKLIALDCNGKVKATLQISFANLSKFGEQEIVHKSKFVSYSSCICFMAKQNKW